MCPVDHVCHQLTCHRRLFSLSRTRNRRFIALFTPIDFAISATPTSQRTLFTYLWYTWRQSWRCAKYSNSIYVAAFHEFLSMCEVTTRSKSATHFQWRAVLSSPSIHAIDMYLSGGRRSHYVHKGGKYDIKLSISWTVSMVCMFFTRNMTAH